jgi:hypothetical protein
MRQQQLREYLRKEKKKKEIIASCSIIFMGRERG